MTKSPTPTTSRSGSAKTQVKPGKKTAKSVPCVPASDVVVPLGGTEGYWLIIGLAILASALWFIPTIGDAHSVHRDREKKLAIYEKLANGADTAAERTEITKKVAELPVEGINALTRGLIALLVMTALVYVLLLLFGSGVTVDSDLMKQAVTALLTTLTAVAAFYFGSRSAETALQEGSAKASTEGPTPPPSPTISGFAPKSGHPGQHVKINGLGLEGATRVVVGGVDALFSSGAATGSLTARVAPEAQTGRIIVTTPGGTATSAEDFEVP